MSTLPSLVGKIELLTEAEEIVVRNKNGKRIVWHGEDIDVVRNRKIVRFPVINPMPKLNEEG